MSAEYASLEVEKVILHPIGIPLPDDAVSKSYVDTHVSTEIALLVDSAPSVLNTLKEIATALGNDANLAVTLANSISAEANSRTLADAGLQTQVDVLSSSTAFALAAAVSTIDSTTASLRIDLTAEVSLRDTQKTALDASIADVSFQLSEESGSRVSFDNASDLRMTAEESKRAADDAALGIRVDDEKKRAEGVEAGHASRLTSAENDKLNKSGGTISGDVVLDSYLYFGADWRVRGSSDGRRLEFQFRKPDGIFRTAIPFISPQ
jgi:hypothetical protein